MLKPAPRSILTSRSSAVRTPGLRAYRDCGSLPVPMDSNEHRRAADALQAEIYRRMTPRARLEQAMRLNRQMRALMDAGLRAEHPDWTPEQRLRVIATRILHARTG